MAVRISSSMIIPYPGLVTSLILTFSRKILSSSQKRPCSDPLFSVYHFHDDWMWVPVTAVNFFSISPRLLISDVQSMSTGSNLISLDFCWLYYIKYYGVKQCCGIRLSGECISAWKRSQDDTQYVVHKMNKFKRFLPKPCISVVCSLVGELCRRCLMRKTILAIEELRHWQLFFWTGEVEYYMIIPIGVSWRHLLLIDSSYVFRFAKRTIGWLSISNH